MADVSIVFHNAEIAALNATGSKILTTAGKFCDDDISIIYTVPASAHVFNTTASTTNNIEFTVPNGKNTGYNVMVLTINPDDANNQGITYYLFDLANDCGYVSSLSNTFSTLTRMVQGVLGSSSFYGVRWTNDNTLQIVRAANDRAFTVGSRYKIALYI